MATTTPAESPISAPMLSLRRFTVDEYHRIAEAGVLTADDRVELLEGWIVEKMTHNPPHDASVALVDEAIRRCIPAYCHTRVQSAVTTSDSEPEPDVVIARGGIRDFAERHPQSGDIGLLIEVSDSSLTNDREKRRLYARAGISVYWIVNLIDSQVEVYTDPTGPDANPRYQDERIYGADQSIPLAIDNQPLGEVAVKDLLP